MRPNQFVHANCAPFPLLVILLFFSLTIQGQNLDFCGRFPYHQAISSNPDSIRYDRFGNSYDIGAEEEFNDPDSRVFELCGYFEISYHSVPSDFQDRICEVFQDISELIEQRINISICGDTIQPSPVRLRIARDSLESGVLGIGSPDFYNYLDESGCFETYTNRLYNRINGGLQRISK